MHSKLRTITWLMVLSCALIGLQAQAAKENFDRSKPHLSFAVKAGDLDMAGFRQVDGLGIDIEVIEYQDGEDLILRKRPGRVKYSNITLERAYRGATDIEEWAMEALRGKMSRREISILIVDKAAAVVRSYNLFECFPTSWKLGTNDEGVITERITLAVERLDGG
jgi:phage tail-like protein